MKLLFRFIVLLLLLCGWFLAAASLHIVRTPQAIIPVGKDRLGLKDTFVDTRAWSADDLAKHPSLVARLQAAGKGDALKHVPTTQPAPK